MNSNDIFKYLPWKSATYKRGQWKRPFWPFMKQNADFQEGISLTYDLHFYSLKSILKLNWEYKNFQNHFIVPHFKALIRGQNLWGWQRCGSTLRLWNALLKISILLHKWAKGPFSLSMCVSDHYFYVCRFGLIWILLVMK